MTTVTVTVTDETGATATTTLTLVVAPAPLTILTTSLPAGQVGVPYNATVAASGGTLPYTWSATLPAGLSIDPHSGVISGTPT